MNINYDKFTIGKCPNCNKSVAECSCSPKSKIESKELLAIALLIIGLLVFALVIN